MISKRKDCRKKLLRLFYKTGKLYDTACIFSDRYFSRVSCVLELDGKTQFHVYCLLYGTRSFFHSGVAARLVLDSGQVDCIALVLLALHERRDAFGGSLLLVAGQNIQNYGDFHCLSDDAVAAVDHHSDHYGFDRLGKTIEFLCGIGVAYCFCGMYADALEKFFRFPAQKLSQQKYAFHFAGGLRNFRLYTDGQSGTGCYAVCLSGSAKTGDLSFLLRLPRNGFDGSSFYLCSFFR